MSTILDALRRVERERRPPADARSLREAVASGDEAGDAAAASAWRTPLITLLLGLGLGAGALVFWGGGLERETTRNPLPGESTAVNLAAPAGQAAAPAGQAAAPAGQAAAPAGQAAAPAGQAAAPARQAAAPAEPPAVVKELPSTAAPERPLFKRLRVNQLRPGHATMLAAQAPLPRGRGIGPGGTAAPYAFEPPPPRAAPKPRAAVVPVAPSPPAPPAPPAPPVARESPLAVQVERTFWHPRAERREAILRLPGQEESVRVREGEQLGSFTVTLIEPSRVIFEKDGVQIARRLKAQ